MVKILFSNDNAYILFGKFMVKIFGKNMANILFGKINVKIIFSRNMIEFYLVKIW